jgi:hypothetical protein
MRRAWCLLLLITSCQENKSITGTDTLPPGVRAAVLEHHNGTNRQGVYVDSAMTREAVRHLREDTWFSAPVSGSVHAQPLYWDGGDGGQDLLLVFTETNEAIAFDPLSGARVWVRTLAPPAPRDPTLCGNLNPLGITGTPVIDFARKLIFLDAMTTPDNGMTRKHLVFTLSVLDGSLVGQPVDLDSSLPGFDSARQNQRGALTLLNDVLYVPFGAHAGDCASFSGWVIGIDTRGVRPPSGYHAALGGGIWSALGVASMGGALFVGTGNTFQPAQWGGGEAILKLTPGPSFSGSASDYYTPSSWRDLDRRDADLGSSGALPFDVGPAHLVVAMGKDSMLHVADRDGLGGVGGGLLAQVVASREIVAVPAVIGTPAGIFLAFTGAALSCGGGAGLAALRINGGPPLSIEQSWCANVLGRVSTIATTTGGGAEAIFWAADEFRGQLHAVAADTGAVLYQGGTVGVSRFNGPIVAKGRVYLAGSDGIHAFTVR